MLRWAGCAAALVLLGCGGGSRPADAHPATAAAGGEGRRITEADVAAIYAAVLGHQRSTGGALNPLLMSDSGTFEPHGELSPAISRALVGRSVGELCTMRAGRYWPECFAPRAGAEVRFSWPRPAGGDTVMLFVAHANLPPPPGDTKTVFFEFAYSHRCRVARSEKGWRVVRCDQWMVT